MTVLDLTDPEFIQNPYGVYDRLRRDDPVHYSKMGFWFLTRYEDVCAALRNPGLSNRPSRFSVVHESNRTRHVCADVAANLVAFRDGPKHREPRRIFAKTLTALIKERQSLVRNVAESMVARLAGKSAMEFSAEFAEPFAATCITQMMGLPSADVARLKAWSNLLFYMFHHIPPDIVDSVNQGLAEFRSYIEQVLESRRQSPQDDFLTHLLDDCHVEHELSPEEMVDNTMLLIADGIENVQAGLTGAISTVLRHREAIDAIRGGGPSIHGIVDECLRYESPGQYQGRIALEPIVIGGKTIRANSVVLLGIGAANRDPSVFQEPHRFVVDRKGAGHLAFGLGRHACIGGALFRAELEAALVGLFDGSIELALCQDSMTWTTRAGHRWPAELRLNLARRAGRC